MYRMARSTRPLVRAHRGWQTLGRNPTRAAKSASRGFDWTSPRSSRSRTPYFMISCGTLQAFKALSKHRNSVSGSIRSVNSTYMYREKLNT